MATTTEGCDQIYKALFRLPNGKRPTTKYRVEHPSSHSKKHLVSMNFIIEFPKTQSGYDFVLVVVDQFSKLSHFLPCRKTSNVILLITIFFKKLFAYMVC